MATAGEMIKVVAHAIARPHATVTSYYSVLRKAGMISTTGRGRSAQDLSSLDVARILIVMLSADNLQEGAAITELMGNSLCLPWHEDDQEALGSISFEDAIANIIAFRANIAKGRPATAHPLLGDLTQSEITISATPTHLEACIETKTAILPFCGTGSVDTTMTYPDEWHDIPIHERLELRAMMEGMKVTRSINDLMIRIISEKMP